MKPVQRSITEADLFVEEVLDTADLETDLKKFFDQEITRAELVESFGMLVESILCSVQDKLEGSAEARSEELGEIIRRGA